MDSRDPIKQLRLTEAIRLNISFRGIKQGYASWRRRLTTERLPTAPAARLDPTSGLQSEVERSVPMLWDVPHSRLPRSHPPDPMYVWPYNNLVWLMATCPDANYRGGRRQWNGDKGAIEQLEGRRDDRYSGCVCPGKWISKAVKYESKL